MKSIQMLYMLPRALLRWRIIVVYSFSEKLRILKSTVVKSETETELCFGVLNNVREKPKHMKYKKKQTNTQNMM